LQPEKVNPAASNRSIASPLRFMKIIQSKENRPALPLESTDKKPSFHL